jgi:hypothetical protein
LGRLTVAIPTPSSTRHSTFSSCISASRRMMWSLRRRGGAVRCAGQLR